MSYYPAHLLKKQQLYEPETKNNQIGNSVDKLIKEAQYNKDWAGVDIYYGDQTNDFGYQTQNDRFILNERIRQERSRERELDRLTRHSGIIKPKKLHEYTVLEHFIRMKDELFSLLDELLQGNITIQTFTKNNRLIYLGLLLVIFVSFYLLFVELINFITY